MATNLYQQLNPQPNNLLKSINPQQIVSNMLQANPKLRNTLDLIKMSNKSPRELFYEEAHKKGVDPNSILNMIR